VISPAGREPGRVCVLYAGGTVGARNLTPELYPDDLRMFSLTEVASELRLRNVTVEHTFQPLHDDQDVPAIVSSTAGPAQWATLADRIGELYDDYDGFVVLHGTDTMAWMASALSFMFTNLGKPVVLTGSQRPIRASPSDAVPNFVHAITLAGRAADDIPLIPEVVICFGGRVLRGNRAQKLSAASLRGFASPNEARLGRIGRKVDVSAARLLPPPPADAPFLVNSTIETRIADVSIYPGMTPEHLEGAITGCVGFVLRTFGAGNAPANLEPVLAQAVARGVVVVNVTQCTEGVVESGMLSGNNALARLGVISGLDLTPEAALTKLGVLLGQHQRDIAAEQMQLDLRGEQSLDLVQLRPVHHERVSDGIQRFVLTPALHARVRPERLLGAVLRLTGDALTVDPATRVRVYLNHWNTDGLDPGGPTEDPRPLDLRCMVDHSWPDGADGERRPFGALAFDVTGSVRGLLLPGAPVTATVVSSLPLGVPDVLLSIFVKRDVELP
jgi:L-asparaginase